MGFIAGRAVAYPHYADASGDQRTDDEQDTRNDDNGDSADTCKLSSAHSLDRAFPTVKHSDHHLGCRALSDYKV